jgi:hypothetical protein
MLPSTQGTQRTDEEEKEIALQAPVDGIIRKIALVTMIAITLSRRKSGKQLKPL